MRTLDDLRRWAASAPRGTMLSAEALHDVLGGLEPELTPEPVSLDEATPTWRVLLWTVAAETRIGRDELLEAVSRPASWLYRHTGAKSKDRIPHRRLDGHLVFVVGEVRRWLREREEIVAARPLDGAAGLRSVQGGA